METWRPNLAHPDGLDFSLAVMNLHGPRLVSGAG